LTNKRDAPQVERLDEGHKALAMKIERVNRLVHRLVRAAKAKKIGRHDTMPGIGKDRDHMPIKIAPGRLSVQPKKAVRRVARTFIEPVHAQPSIAWQGLGVMRSESVTRQIGKPLVRRA